MRTWAVVGLVIGSVGCGGDAEPLELDDDAGALVVEADAGSRPADAGAAATPDAAKPAARAQCEPDAGVGAETTAAACWSRAELAARGCALVWTGTASASGTSTKVQPGAAAAADAARFALLYNAPGQLGLYMCSSAAPATDWRCSVQAFADCSVSGDAGTCDNRITAPALPTLHAICAQQPG